MALLQPVEGPRALHERRKLEVFDPATLERVGEIEVATTEDVRVAVEHARKAFESWHSLSFRERERYMLAARDVIAAWTISASQKESTYARSSSRASKMDFPSFTTTSHAR